MIDDKLRTLLKDQEGSIKHCCGQPGTDDVEWDIVQIKQAFINEGWHEECPPRVTDATLYPLIWAKSNGYMTGQEWYDKFGKELGDLSNGTTELVRPEVYEAARKAAGL